MPDLDAPQDLVNLVKAINLLRAQGLLLAYHDRSDGGLLAAVAEMAFAGHVGVALNVDMLVNEGDGISDSRADHGDAKNWAGQVSARRDEQTLKALFNEELGVVVQVRSSDRTAVLQVLREHGLSKHSHVIGKTRPSSSNMAHGQGALSVWRDAKEVFSAPLVDLHQVWDSVSWKITRERDNPACADAEHAAAGLATDPGMHVTLSFDPNDNVAAPFLNLSKPKVAILREQGVNSHVEMAYAFHKAGFESHDVHMTDLQSGRARLADFKGLVACGGFSYGDTLGAVGVGELENFMTGLFRPLLLACDRLEVPEDPRRELVPDLTGWAARLTTARADMAAFFAQHGPRLAAFIAEPLIQCAGGMRIWPPELLTELRAQCDAHGVYLIFDEVATGFGRTGTFLACEQAAVAPDLLCLSKGLTGGMLPLSITWATEELYGHFWGTPASGRAFLHGHSYTANPTACAVACASLALFDDEPVLAQAQVLAEALRSAFGALATHPAIRQARTLGAIGACRLVDPATGVAHAAEARFGWRLHRAALDRGLLVRPMGDCLYLLPPLSTPPARIAEAAETLLHLLG